MVEWMWEDWQSDEVLTYLIKGVNILIVTRKQWETNLTNVATRRLFGHMKKLSSIFLKYRQD